MAKLVVDINEVKTYSDFFENTSKDFSTIVSNISSIISSLKSDSNWNGTDADAFVSNATGYLAGLKKVKENLLEISESIKKNATEYDKRCEDFKSAIGG